VDIKHRKEKIMDKIKYEETKSGKKFPKAGNYNLGSVERNYPDNRKVKFIRDKDGSVRKEVTYE